MNGFVVCLFVAGLALTNAQEFECPNDKTGQFKHPTQCDKYYTCDDGVATERLCPDGLVFDETIRLKNKCDQPFNVDCEDRVELQPPKGTHDKCPRRNGFFAHPNPGVCNIFYNCIDNDANENRCPGNLHFDELSGTCAWPEAAGRTGCKTAEELNTDPDQFVCPTIKERVSDSGTQNVAHPKYPDLKDCQKFYVCLNGIEKRTLGCQHGEVYDEESQQCTSPERVPGCEDWYKDDSEDDEKPVKKSRK